MSNIKYVKEKVAQLKILIVDDEELIKMLMKNFMERLFGTVETADDGQDALDKWNRLGPFDVVLTDIRMPNMTGRELIQILKQQDNTPYVIVVSGDLKDAEDNLTSGDVYMNKPIGFDQILATLSEMIEKKNL